MISVVVGLIDKFFCEKFMKRDFVALEKAKKLKIVICPDVIRFARFYRKFHGINWPGEMRCTVTIVNFTG